MHLQIEAMALNVPALPHVNKTKFSGILTRVGEVSTSAPSGSGGKRIMITAAAAERALPSLIGMGVNFKQNSAHSKTSKVGVITAAHIDGNALKIEGSFWSFDHPAEIRLIQASQNSLGFSFEAAEIVTVNDNADPLVITALTFTGASVLLKASGAYVDTAIAAAADPPREIQVHRDLKKLLDRANIQPPAPGMVLTAAFVNERLTTAKMSPDERITLKRELVAMKMLSEGTPYSVFSQS